MDWTINVMFALILTTITGSILFGIWYSIGKVLEMMGFINVMYELQKAVLVFYFVPAAFIFLCGLNYDYWGGIVFRNTPLIVKIAEFGTLFWLGGAGVLMVRYVLMNWMMEHKYRTMVPVDGDVLKLFDEICTELGIRIGKIDLVEDYNQTIPCICGMRKVYVVLPLKDYTMDELRVIFIHELTHYKQGNHLLRHSMAIAFALHFFNPVIWAFRNKIRYWGEYACDYEAIVHCSDIDHYFGTIHKMIPEEPIRFFLDVRLFENKDELLDREARMRRSYRMKNKSKLFATLVVCGMVAVSGVSVKAATVTAGNQYYNAYMTTVENQSETLTGNDELVEYEVDGFDPGVVVESAPMGEIEAYDLNTYNWKINAKRVMTSKYFSCKSGGKLAMAVVTSPAGASVRMGIIEPSGTMRYVLVSGIGSHTFELDETGKYSIYVQNMTTLDIGAAGSFQY